MTEQEKYIAYVKGRPCYLWLRKSGPDWWFLEYRMTKRLHVLYIDKTTEKVRMKSEPVEDSKERWKYYFDKG